jgi:hypothetical protein
MQLKTLLYGMPLISTMITNHLARWKTMQLKAPLWCAPYHHNDHKSPYFFSWSPQGIEMRPFFIDRAALTSTAL